MMNAHNFLVVILGALLVYCLPALNTEKAPNEPPEEKSSLGTTESDIVLSPEQMQLIHEGELAAKAEETNQRVKRKAKRDESYYWPGGIVPYLIDDNAATYRNTILSAMEHWEKQTCIRFKPYTDKLGDELGHHDRIILVKGDGCSSPVGRQRTGAQTISLGDTCNNLGTVAHEIGHSLGFYHEQTRPDRDKYITIQAANIKSMTQHNFIKYERTEGSDYNVPYDLGSIMHYGEMYYSKNGKATIDTRDRRMQNVIGQREELSFYDVRLANLMYKCGDGCASKTCENHGYVGPGCRCMCPLGLSGDTCTEVTSLTQGCGGILKGNSGSFSSPNYPRPYSDSADCSWFIPGGPGVKITLKIDDFDIEYDEMCNYDWLEVRILGPQFRGPRFCGKNKPDFPIKVKNQGLFIRFHSDGDNNFKGFSASFRIIQCTVPINGGWSPWASWQNCSRPCGYGIRRRRRGCGRPSPAHGGANCEGRPLSFTKCYKPC